VKMINGIIRVLDRLTDGPTDIFGCEPIGASHAPDPRSSPPNTHVCAKDMLPRGNSVLRQRLAGPESNDVCLDCIRESCHCHCLLALNRLDTISQRRPFLPYLLLTAPVPVSYSSPVQKRINSLHIATL
jgi:hypothetical protein